MLVTSQAQDRTEQVFLGLYSRPVEAALSTHLKLKAKQGFLVSKIFPKSPAAKAGLQRFDILLSINGQNIFSDIPLTKALEVFKAGEQIKITLLREGEVIHKDVVLGTKPQELCKSKACPSTAPIFDERLKLHLYKMLRDGKTSEQIFETLEKHIRKVQEKSMNQTNSSYQHSTIKVSKKDKEHHISLSFDSQGRYTTIKDLQGKIIYSGRLDTEIQKKRIPQNILKKIESLSAQAEKHFKKNNIPYGKKAITL